jgi:hypothetical protein
MAAIEYRRARAKAFRIWRQETCVRMPLAKGDLDFSPKGNPGRGSHACDFSMKHYALFAMVPKLARFQPT